MVFIFEFNMPISLGTLYYRYIALCGSCILRTIIKF